MTRIETPRSNLIRVWVRVCLRVALLCVFLPQGALAATYLHSKCAPDTDIQQKLAAWSELRETMYFAQDWFAAGIAVSDRIAAQHPQDIYIQREHDAWLYQDPARRATLLADRQARYKKQPNDATAAYLYARLLSFERAPQTVPILERMAQRNPKFPQVRILLAGAYRHQAGKAGAVAEKQQLIAYRKLCPGNVEGFKILHRFPQDGFAQQQLLILTDYLEAHLTPQILEHIRSYWDNAFWVLPPDQHNRVREQVGRWLEKLGRNEANLTPADLQTLAAGFELAGNSEGKAWTEERILTRFPKTNAARQVIESRWQIQQQLTSAAAASVDAATDRAAYQAHLSQLIALVPYAPDLINANFQRARASKETSDEEILTLGTQMQALMLSPPRYDFNYIQSPLLTVADEFVSRGIGLDQVADLVGASFQSMARFRKSLQESARDSETSRNRMLTELDAQEALGLGLLTEVLAQRGNVSVATRYLGSAMALLARFALIDPGDKRYAITLSALSRYHRAVAALELARGNRQTALHALRLAQSWAHQSNPAYRPTRDVIAERIASLESGLGAPTTADAGSGGTIAVDRTATRPDWAEYTGPFPSLSLVDLKGKRWQMSDWKGKTVFLNYWATWCGPCQAELQLIQTLREKYAQRDDVVFFTINLDDDISLVAPFLSRLKIDLPVLLGGRRRESLLESSPGSVPVSYILDGQGKVRLRNIGFSAKDWLANADAALHAVAVISRSTKTTSRAHR